MSYGHCGLLTLFAQVKKLKPQWHLYVPHCCGSRADGKSPDLTFFTQTLLRTEDFQAKSHEKTASSIFVVVMTSGEKKEEGHVLEWG